MSIVDDRICHLDTALDRIQIYDQPLDAEGPAPDTGEHLLTDANGSPIEDSDTISSPTDDARVTKLKSVSSMA